MYTGADYFCTQEHSCEVLEGKTQFEGQSGGEELTGEIRFKRIVKYKSIQTANTVNTSDGRCKKHSR